MNNPFDASNHFSEWLKWITSRKSECAMPDIQFEGYWEKEFSGAYSTKLGKATDWDGELYNKCNKIMNQLATEGEALL